MVQAILVALAVLAMFGPGIIYGMYGDRMGADTKKIFLVVWALLVLTVFSTINIVNG